MWIKKGEKIRSLRNGKSANYQNWCNVEEAMDVQVMRDTGSTVSTCPVYNCTIIHNCTMKTVDGCDFPSGNFIHYKPVSYNINGTVLILLSIVAHLKWSSICLIFDNETGKLKYCFLIITTLEQLCFWKSWIANIHWKLVKMWLVYINIELIILSC